MTRMRSPSFEVNLPDLWLEESGVVPHMLRLPLPQLGPTVPPLGPDPHDAARVIGLIDSDPGRKYFLLEEAVWKRK